MLKLWKAAKDFASALVLAAAGAISAMGSIPDTGDEWRVVGKAVYIAGIAIIVGAANPKYDKYGVGSTKPE